MELPTGYFSNRTKSTRSSFESRDGKEKNCLVLDLDETLIYSQSERFNQACVQVDVLCMNKKVTVYVLPRPGLVEFLKEMEKYYKLYIYTSSNKRYAEAILHKLQILDHFEKVYSRDYCTAGVANKVEKNLKLLNLPLNRTIFIDDSSVHVMQNASNSFQIKPFKNNLKDNELFTLIPLLSKLSTESEVRPVGKNIQKRVLGTDDDWSPKERQPAGILHANKLPDSHPKTFITGMHQRNRSCMDARTSQQKATDLVPVERSMKSFQKKLLPLTILKRNKTATIITLYNTKEKLFD